MEGEPTQAAAEQAAPVSDASEQTAESSLQPGDTSVQTEVASSDEGGEPTAEAEAPDSADAEDLAKYPEEVRERFRALTPEQRKEQYEFYEYAGKHVEERIRREKERNDALAAKAADEKQRREALQAKLGPFIGAEATERIDRYGNKQQYPSLDDALRLNQNPRGRQQALEQYGLDEDALSDYIEDRQERLQMLEGSVDWSEAAALSRIDGRMRDSFKELGLDLDQVLEGVTDPIGIVPAVARHYEAQIKKLKDDHAAETKAHTLNAAGMRAQVAASGRPLATGGRSGGAPPMDLTPEQYAAMSYEERQKLRSTSEGRARIDAMMSGSRR